MLFLNFAVLRLADGLRKNDPSWFYGTNPLARDCLHLTRSTEGARFFHYKLSRNVFE